MSTRTHRFLITGLCLQGNKGGPALALSLAEAIRSEIPTASFVFSVPAAPEEWLHELRWAERYGFEVCQQPSLSGLIPPFCFRTGRLKRMIKWWKTLRGCDALIQMSAICYFGPPAGPGTLRSLVRSPRVFDFLVSLMAQRPMRAWTQSYGPLSTSAIRFLAKCDLRRQPLVFCRGDDCADAVRKLLPNHPAKSFPDVAVTLGFDRAWGAEYVTRNIPSVGRFVTLSPSAVMFSRAAQDGNRNRHLEQCLEVCARLVALDYSVLLVPHTLRPTQHDPTRCDLTVAEMIRQSVNTARVAVVVEDLSPMELKSIIANAEFHIGARYHSVVAALSSGVPALSLSWHPKYRDLMRTYGMEDFLVDESAHAELTPLLERLRFENAGLRRQLVGRQADAVQQVRENARLFCALLPGHGDAATP